MPRRRLILILGALAVLVAVGLWAKAFFEPRHVVDVYPGGDIQQALESVALLPGKRTVRVHAGTYRPGSPGQAFIYFNARHDGIILEALGDVVLTAANPDVAEPSSPGYPAIVNHVVYFGDGISAATTIRGFKITGANGFVSGPPDLLTVRTCADLEKSSAYRSVVPSPIEANDRARKSLYFYTDGGGILVYGRSYPTIDAVQVYENYASVCAGGVSVQHGPGAFRDSVLFKNCVFRDNRAAVSGSGVDLLTPGSWRRLRQLPVRRQFEQHRDRPERRTRIWRLDCPSGGCRATVQPLYLHAATAMVWTTAVMAVATHAPIFWRNNREGGASPAARYELAVSSGGVTGCSIGGQRNRSTCSATSVDRRTPSDRLTRNSTPISARAARPTRASATVASIEVDTARKQTALTDGDAGESARCGCHGRRSHAQGR